jgi:hypothetical protein
MAPAQSTLIPAWKYLKVWAGKDIWSKCGEKGHSQAQCHDKSPWEMMMAICPNCWNRKYPRVMQKKMILIEADLGGLIWGLGEQGGTSFTSACSTRPSSKPSACGWPRSGA